MQTLAPVSTSAPASTYDEVKPLVELCKAGKLFAVQQWIAAGKPVNAPSVAKGQRPKTPLDVALGLGFHSLIEVLLDAGATSDRNGWNSPMHQALEMKRLDIVELLVKHCDDPADVDMKQVFATWDPVLMEYFIEQGADVERGNPLAFALCERIRTALSIFKRYRERFVSFQKQINIALRHHCKEGNLKWASLLLWAGADPYADGPDHWDAESTDADGGICALR